jgi:hypothetical protein
VTTDGNREFSETTAFPQDGMVEKRGLAVNAPRPTDPASFDDAIAFIGGGDQAPPAPAAAPAEPPQANND